MWPGYSRDKGPQVTAWRPNLREHADPYPRRNTYAPYPESDIDKALQENNGNHKDKSTAQPNVKVYYVDKDDFNIGPKYSRDSSGSKEAKQHFVNPTAGNMFNKPGVYSKDDVPRVAGDENDLSTSIGRDQRLPRAQPNVKVYYVDREVDPRFTNKMNTASSNGPGNGDTTGPPNAKVGYVDQPYMGPAAPVNGGLRKVKVAPQYGPEEVAYTARPFAEDDFKYGDIGDRGFRNEDIRYSHAY